MVLPLHHCFHSSDSGLPGCPQPRPGGQVSAGGAKQPAAGTPAFPLAWGLFAQLHFHVVKYSI